MGHREALLDGARRCLLERGYARTTARDVVAASHTNLASISYHFGSKEALLNEALQQCIDEYLEQITRIVFADPSATPLQRVRASWQALVDTLEQYRPLKVAFAEALVQAERMPQLRAQLAECYERARSSVADMVRASVEGLSDPTAARQVASFLIAVYHGLQTQWLLDPQRAPLPDELMAALELALPAVGATERATKGVRPAPHPLDGSRHGDLDREQAWARGAHGCLAGAPGMQGPDGPVAGGGEEPERPGG
jgi:AcrR family transcriptional regulator